MSRPLLTSLTDIPRRTPQSFTVKEPIACGRYGTVYKVSTAQNPDSFFAVKQLPTKRQDINDIASFHKSILNEIHHLTELKQVDAKHVVRLLDVYQDEENVCLEMEYCTKGSIESIQSSIPLSQKQILIFVRQLINALKEVHALSIYHGDIKPGNVLVTEGDILKLGDFGNSSKVSGPATGCFTKTATPMYAAPEIFDGQCGTAADVWALAIVAFQLFFPGVHPFFGQEKPTSGKALQEVIKKEPIAWPTIDTSLPIRIKDLIHACLDKDPLKRPRADELIL